MLLRGLFLFSLLLSNMPCGAAAQDTTLIDAVWGIVADTYHDATFNGVDWPAVRGDFDGRDTHAAVEAMLARLDDPAVRFLQSSELAVLMSDLSGQSGTGVGLMELLSVDMDERTGRLTVVTPVPGTSAARAGLQPRDVIAAIDGAPTGGMALHDAAALLRGDAGTAVTLTIQRGDDAFEVSLERTVLAARETVHAALRREEGLTIGYVRLEQFLQGSAQQVRAALTALAGQGAKALVLDLRNNPGGFLPEVVATADLFLPSGLPLAYMTARGDTLQTLTTSEPVLTDSPLAVLINEGSASAAEVLAGALHDHGRAVLVGSRTFGKGLAHAVQVLGDGTAVMLPVARLMTPAGRDILHEAIVPDVAVEATSSPVLDARLEPASAQDAPYVRAVSVLRQGGRQP